MNILRTFTFIAKTAGDVIGTVNPGAGLLLTFVEKAFLSINAASGNNAERSRMLMELVSWMLRVASEIAQACADGEVTPEEFETIKTEIAAIKSLWNLE